MSDAPPSASASAFAESSRPSQRDSPASSLQTPTHSSRATPDLHASASTVPPPPVSPINKSADLIVFSVSAYLQQDTELFVSGDPWNWSTDRSEIVKLQRMPTGRSNHDGPAYIWSGSCQASDLPETFEYKYLWLDQNLIQNSNLFKVASLNSNLIRN